MTAYYNEFDSYAAQWLRNLIEAGHIAPGVVDERSIADVTPDELSGFTQCHFFAGIGVWSYSLRLAGWPDDRPVWTGSCPCQPFSAAGKGGGFDDERHLWPAFHWLIDQCRPPVVMGEQVASKDGLGWLDLVSADMEGSGYAFGANDTCVAGVGGPHIRQRIFFGAARLGNADGTRATSRISESAQRESRNAEVHDDGGDRLFRSSPRRSEPSRMADTSCRGDAVQRLCNGPAGQHVVPVAGASGGSSLRDYAEGDRTTATRDAGEARVQSGRLADADGGEQRLGNLQSGGQLGFQSEDRGPVREGDSRPRAEVAEGLERPGPTNGFWGSADWLFCRDGKWRPVEPGTFPLVARTAFDVGSGSTFEGKSRAGMLKGYGNAICAEVGAIEVETFAAAIVDLAGLPRGEAAS